MRLIGYIVNLYPAVSHTFIRREIEALERLGWKVHRFALRCSPDLADERDLAERERTDLLLPLDVAALWRAALLLVTRPGKLIRGFAMGVKMAWRSESGFLRALAMIPEAMVLLVWCRRHHIEHVHSHFVTNATSVARIAHAFGGPTFSFTSHAPAELHDPFRNAVVQKCREATFIAAISHYARSQLCRLLAPDLWDKVVIIRCGLEFSGPEVAVVPIPPAPRLLAVGRLAVEKGQLVLVRAFQDVVREHRSAQLTLAGDGPMRSLLEREVTQRGLCDHVHFAGWVDGRQIDKLLAASRVLVLSSFAEGLPIVLMEAFRAGCPVIATNVGAIAELVEPGVSGWLVPPGDEQGLAHAMKQALSRSDEHLADMGKAGLEKVRRQHDIDEQAQTLAQHFERALGVTERDAQGRLAGATRTEAVGAVDALHSALEEN